MKKHFTLAKFALASLAFMMAPSLFAQVAVTKSGVDGSVNYATIKEALVAINADAAVVDGSIVTFEIGAVTITETNTSPAIPAITKAIKLTVKGAGAANTTVVASIANTHRLFGFTANKAVDLTLQGITFKNFGFSTTVASTNGGGVVNFNQPGDFKATITDCVFEGCSARQGAAIQSTQEAHIVNISGCTFKSCISFEVSGVRIGGVLHLSGSKEVSVKNCTFINNETHAITSSITTGGCISISQSTNVPQTITLEGNTFTNNLVKDAGATDSPQPVVSIKHSGAYIADVSTAPNKMNVDFKNNTFSGNKRAGVNQDCDLLFADMVLPTTSRIVFTPAPSGNSVPTAYTAGPTSVNSDGVAAATIAWVTDGTTKVIRNSANKNLNIVTGSNQIEVLNVVAGETVTVYSVTGVVVVSKVATSSSVVLPVAKGMYIVKTNSGVSKVLVK